MDRTDTASLELGHVLAEPAAPADEQDQPAPPRKLLGVSTGAIRNVLTALIVGAVIIGLVRFFDSPSASATQSVNVTGEASGPPPKVGKPVADFEAQTPDGKTVHVSDFKGHPIWITFWASWCPPCRAENPDVQAVYTAHQPEGLVVLAVNLGEDAKTVQGYVQRTGLTFPVALDPLTSIAATYRIVGIPTHFFVDADGNLVEQRIGGMSKKMMESRIQSLIAKSGSSAAGQ